MKNKLKVLSTLIYYDVPHLFLGRDVVGTTHLCLLVDDSDDSLKYLTTPISPNRVSKVINGTIDIREVFEIPELNTWQIIEEFDEEYGYASKAEFQKVPEGFLPEAGFFLIQADILGDFVKLFQSLLKNLYKKTISKLPKNDRKSLDQEYNWALRAFASSPGSFNIHIESTAQTELFGGTNIEKALSKLDVLTNSFNDSEMYIELLRDVKGHSITSYKKIVEKIIKENIKIKYKWYSPGEKIVHKRELSKIFAEQVLVIINQKNDLSQEIREFKGYIKSADVKTNSAEEKSGWKTFTDSVQQGQTPRHAGK